MRKIIKSEQLKNMNREFDKLLMFLSEKYPNAYYDYISHLRPNNEFTKEWEKFESSIRK